jgi:hypothetical protein
LGSIPVSATKSAQLQFFLYLADRRMTGLIVEPAGLI